MEVWIAAGDETGKWDIVDGRFRSDFTGLAWVLGAVAVWERALQMPLGDSTALEVFSQSFAKRLPSGRRELLDVRLRKRQYELVRDVLALFINARKGF